MTDYSAKWKLVTLEQVNMSQWGVGTENWRAFERQNTVYRHDTFYFRSPSKVQYCGTAAQSAISRWENSYSWCWICGPTHTCYYIAGPLSKNLYLRPADLNIYYQIPKAGNLRPIQMGHCPAFVGYKTITVSVKIKLFWIGYLAKNYGKCHQ